MLALSCALLAYPLLFVKKENELLLSMPLGRAGIAACRIVETIFLGSWAFFLTGTPIMLAYFHLSETGLRGFAFSWIFFIPLVVLAGAAGSSRRSSWGGSFRAGCRRPCAARRAPPAAAAALLIGRHGGPAGAGRSLGFVDQVVSKCRLASWFPLPSSWAAEGIFAAARGARGGAWLLWGRS